MKLPTAIVTKHKIRDSKILSLYATDAWSFEEIGKRFGISATRVGQIIYKNRGLLEIDRKHEKAKRINRLQRILKTKGDLCVDKDAIDVMDKLRQECESSGSESMGRSDTRVIIIREAATAPGNRISEVIDGDQDQSRSVSGSVSVVRV
jgi:predicted DNA-binding protein YlxM (UPF0122 family)